MKEKASAFNQTISSNVLAVPIINRYACWLFVSAVLSIFLISAHVFQLQLNAGFETIGAMESRYLGNVQQKIACVFQTAIVEETSSKRAQQGYKVVATDRFVSEELLLSSTSTEKLDGTCVYIQMFNDRPWLWARLDRKPTKATDKRFKKFQSLHRAWQMSTPPDTPEPSFQWNIDNDFKEVPADWIPASGVRVVDGKAQPDDIGHTPGWVPVDPSSRQHLWHLSSVDLVNELALVLQPLADSRCGDLEITAVPLKELCGCTLELIGTNVNGNPYNMGSKDKPLHLLVRHGSIGFTKPPPLDYEQIKDWFNNDAEGRVEGVVWHCSGGRLFKLHRHHVGLPWPVDSLKLNSNSVKININSSACKAEFEAASVFARLSVHNDLVVKSLSDLSSV